jgi:hypothetical protein
MSVYKTQLCYLYLQNMAVPSTWGWGSLLPHRKARRHWNTSPEACCGIMGNSYIIINIPYGNLECQIEMYAFSEGRIVRKVSSQDVWSRKFKPDDLGSISRTHVKVAGEKWVQEIVLCPPCVTSAAHVYFYNSWHAPTLMVKFKGRLEKRVLDRKQWADFKVHVDCVSNQFLSLRVTIIWDRNGAGSSSQSMTSKPGGQLPSPGLWNRD